MTQVWLVTRTDGYPCPESTVNVAIAASLEAAKRAIVTDAIEKGYSELKVSVVNNYDLSLVQGSAVLYPDGEYDAVAGYAIAGWSAYDVGYMAWPFDLAQ